MLFLWLENSLHTVIRVKIIFFTFFFTQGYFSNMKENAYVLKLRHAFSIMFAILRHLPYLFFSLPLFLSPCHSLRCGHTHLLFAVRSWRALCSQAACFIYIHFPVQGTFQFPYYQMDKSLLYPWDRDLKGPPNPYVKL